MNYFTLVLILFGFSNQILSQSNNSKKVLFVGNSYTYYWNLPQNVHLMAEDQGIDLETFQSTAGGSKWSQHYKGQRGLKTLEKIQSGGFDIVVLQNHSKSTIDYPDSLMHYGQLLAKKIRNSGAQPMLYMTWSREWDPFMIKTIKEKYVELGEIINAPVAPVGLAFDMALKMRSDLDLYAPDGSHQSTTGTYLASCVFYSMLTGLSPVGISPRLITEDADCEKLYINIQSPEDALFCQKVAAKVVNEFID